MPKFKIGRSYGYAGTWSEDIIEADTIEDAEEEAWEVAIESVETWAEPYDEDDSE